MTIKLDELERLAKAATPGEWSNTFAHIIGGPNRRLIADLFGDEQIDHDNADYIAAANPAAILDLIAEVRAFRNETVAHDAFVKAFNASTEHDSYEETQAHGCWESALAASLPYRQAAIDAAQAKEKS